jgi:hypothetical protein
MAISVIHYSKASLYFTVFFFLFRIRHFPGSVAFVPVLVVPSLVDPALVVPGLVVPGSVGVLRLNLQSPRQWASLIRSSRLLPAGVPKKHLVRGEFKFKRDYVKKTRTVKFRKTFASDDFSI